MADVGKRSAVDAGLGYSEGRTPKHARVDEIAPELDSMVMAKMQSMINDGLVQEGEFDNRALSHLASFHRETAIEILDDFVAADMQSIRNKNAYLVGIMGRFQKYGGNMRLHPDVQHRLDRVFKQGLQAGSLDSRCLDALQGLPVPLAINVVDRFASRDLSDIRNVSAFFMSTVRAVEKEESRYAQPGSGGNQSTQTTHTAGFQAQAGAQIVAPPVIMQAGAPPGMVIVPASMLAGLQSIPMTAAGSADNSRKSYGIEQMSMGVRTDEFHDLSECAQYVHPAPALKLQQLWDAGNPLVSLLDDKAWSALADLGAPEALTVIEEVARQVDAGIPRNVSAVFMSVARRYLDKLRHDRFSRNDRQGSSKHFSTSLPPPPSQYHTSSPSSPYSPPRREHRRDRERAPGDFAELSTTLQMKSEELLQHHSRFLSRRHFDEGVIDFLRRLDEQSALQVLDELAANDLSNVRNVPAYIMGICRRHQKSRLG